MLRATLVAEKYIANRTWWAALPVREVAHAIARASKPIDKMNFAHPIVIDIYSRQVGADLNMQRAYLTEDAWEAHGVNVPSEISRVAKGPGATTYRYYLQHLCVPAILEESDAFQKTRQVEEERIRICQILSEADPYNAGLFQAEIKQITKRMFIYDGVRRIEQSKVYVDVAGIRAVLLEKISGPFQRYVAFRKNQAVTADLSTIAKRQIKVRDDELTEEILLNFQEERPEELLERIIIDVWAEFATNPHYGLDVYLSTRIRHGTLKGHLRSPLEEQNLVCQRDSSSAEYKDHPYWLERLRDVAEDVGRALQSHLKVFSADIDDDIETLNGTYLRVRTGVTKRGWFDFRPRKMDVAGVEDAMPSDPSVEEFLEICLGRLWRILQHRLSLARLQIAGRVREHWLRRLLGLRQRVQTLGLQGHQLEIDTNIVRAYTSVDLAMGKVAAWFTLSVSSENPDYAIDLAVDIAAQSVRNCFGRNSIDVRAEVAETAMLKGRTLASLVDAFFILMENVVRHARMDGSTPVLHMSIEAREGLYTVYARNRISGVQRRAAVLARIESIKASLADPSDTGRLAREGGSGFHKLQKIISTDLGSSNTFDFSLDNDNNFVVTLLFDARAIQA
jgi:hypothetical protein